MADKVDHLFKHYLLPNAAKTKTKSSEEEKNFKLSESVIDEYEKLHTVFEYFGRQKSDNALQKDATLTVADVLNLFRKAKVLETNRISTQDFIEIVEKYHANGSGKKLVDKLSEKCLKSFMQANTGSLQINIDIQ